MFCAGNTIETGMIFKLSVTTCLAAESLNLEFLKLQESHQENMSMQ